MTHTKIAEALRNIIQSVLGSDPRPRFQRKPDADGYYSEPLHEDEVKAAIEALAEYDAARQEPAPAQPDEDEGTMALNRSIARGDAEVMASLAAPAQAGTVEGLTDEQVAAYWRAVETGPSLSYAGPRAVVEHRLAALASREAQPAVPQWQPIETAPKDGTLVLLGAQNGVWVGKYVPVFQSGYRPDNPWSSHLLNHDHMAERRTRPTHWMHLPAAPSPTAETGEA